MNENKFKKKVITKAEDDVAIPFINSNEDNKALNQLLYYVYDDNFVLMINELSTSILNYHKITFIHDYIMQKNLNNFIE